MKASSVSVSLRTDGEGYVEDGREIFDDEEDYEAQPNSNKRKSQKKRGGKLPDGPVSKKKSLRNFFGNAVTKEKEVASVEDDNLLKNMLGELHSTTEHGSTSNNGVSIAPKPMRTLRKQATEKEIEMKKYMDKFGKKAQEAKKKSDVKADVRFSVIRFLFAKLINLFHQDILDKLLKEERKSKIKDNKENQKSFTNSMVHDEPEELSSVVSTLSPPEQDSRRHEEEKELLEISMLDDIEDLPIQQLEKAEEMKPTPAPATESPAAPKTLSTKPANIESTIFKELQGIDFDMEIRAEEEGTIDWNNVSCLNIPTQVFLLKLSFYN